MPCKVHQVVHAHTVPDPVSEGRRTHVVESAAFDTRSLEYFLELPVEVVDDLQSRIGQSPLAFASQLLNPVVPCGWDKYIGIVRAETGLFFVCVFLLHRIYALPAFGPFTPVILLKYVNFSEDSA